MARTLGVTLRSLAAIALAVAPTVAAYELLDATGPLVAVVGWGVLFSFALTLSREPIPRGKSVAWLARGLGVLGALVLIADVVIIPLSAYLVWFELAAEGSARGAVSFVFVMLVGYGSALFAAHVTYRPLIVSAAYVGWLSFLAIPVFSRPEPVWILAGAALSVIVAGAARGCHGMARLRAVGHATILAVLTISSALGLARVTAPEGSRFVNDVVSPAFRDAIVTFFPNFPIVYDVPGYGYRFSSTDLSRSPVLSNRALFRVSPVPGGSTYLRTEVFDRFTGSGWRVSPQVAAASEEEDARVADAPGEPVPLSTDDEADTAASLDRSTLTRTEVTILADFYSALPHTLDTTAVAVSGRDTIVFEQSGKALGYVLSDPLLYGARIDLLRATSSRSRAAAEVAGAPEDVAGPEHAEAYLQVPPDLSPDLEALATRLLGETDSQTIVNTLRFLRDGFEYTLEPPGLRERDRFLEAFIEEHRRGFCVHFATAFVALSRMQGIPARYVTGFLVRPPPPEEYGAALGPEYGDGVVVSGYSAHAWAEVFLPDVGWRTVEATPPMQPVGYEDTFFERFESIRNEGRTFPQLSEILREQLSSPGRRRGLAFELPELPLWLWGLPFVVLGGAGAVLVWRSRDTATRFKSTMRRIVRRSVGSGAPSPETAGWTGWSAHGDTNARRVAYLALAVSFGGRRPTRRDVRFLKLYRRWL